MHHLCLQRFWRKTKEKRKINSFQSKWRPSLYLSLASLLPLPELCQFKYHYTTDQTKLNNKVHKFCSIQTITTALVHITLGKYSFYFLKIFASLTTWTICVTKRRIIFYTISFTASKHPMDKSVRSTHKLWLKMMSQHKWSADHSLMWEMMAKLILSTTQLTNWVIIHRLLIFHPPSDDSNWTFLFIKWL